jgi:diguanylate cyclase (GGDEF)-like protein/putative nucleotidyltransferase with HDIG domain
MDRGKKQRMKDLSLRAKLYLLTIYWVGFILFVWNVAHFKPVDLLMTLALSILASLFLFIRAKGPTNRSHYTFSFLIYGFAFVHLSLAETMLVVLVSALVEWAWNRPPWFIRLFNTCVYISLFAAAHALYGLTNPSGTLSTPAGILSIIISMGLFTLLNHLLVGMIVWLARGENFKVSGVFNSFPLLMDLTLLTFGAILNMVLNINPYALILFLFPLYLIFATLRIPDLERKTEIDQKTGLYNHNYFMQHLAKELDRSKRFDRPLSIIMLDLDLLRNINNTYGHLAGDEVLIGIARILKKLVREYDVVARFGGEEFIIMLPETTVKQSFERAEMIRREIESAEFDIPTSVISIKATISLGLAERETFTQTAEEIIHNADAALYHSKLNGRNKSSAYRNDGYLNFFGLGPREGQPLQRSPENALDEIAAIRAAAEFSVTETKYTPPVPASQPAGKKQPDQAAGPAPAHAERSKGRFRPVFIYIGGLALLAAGLFYGLYRFAPELYQVDWLKVWPGLLTSTLLVIITELYSIDLYNGKVSLSTSAVPILAGTLLFGPLAGLLLCTTYTIVVGIKYRSKFNKYVFNLSNQVIAEILYLLALRLIGKPWEGFSLAIQAILIVLAALLVYGVNTWVISFGMGIDLHQSPHKIWMEQYLWLATIYVGIGLIATAYIVGYRFEGVLGILLMMVPLFVLRISQKQYVDRTRQVVTELREKSMVLEKNGQEINRLNDGLLETLAEVIDLRDPNVLGHSKRVTTYAVALAEKLGLNEKQIRLIHKASLLHDIGKLGIPLEILKKPTRLTQTEYETIKKHPDLGGNLVKNSPSLLALVPIIRHHHEFYNGMGYPEKLAGNQIPLEARIVSVADALEAMTSDRPYRKRMDKTDVINELRAFSGTQFDPLVVGAAIQLLEQPTEMEPGKLASQPAPIPDPGSDS